MWKDSVEVKVIRLEGFSRSSAELSLYLYIDDVLHDQLLPITEEKSLLLSEEGVYRIEITNQDNSEEKTVSFKRELFIEDSVRWIPVFSQPQDFIAEIPENVHMPRILLLFYRKRALSLAHDPIIFEEPEEIPVANGQIELNDEPLISRLSPDDKLVQDYKVALEFERKLRDEQEKNIEKLSKEIHEVIERSRKREDSLLQLISEKEKELQDAQNEIIGLRSKVRKTEIEKSNLEDVIESLKSEKECLNVDGLRREIEMFTNYFSDCDEITKLRAQIEAYEAKDQAVKEQEEILLEVLKGKKIEAKRENDPVFTVGGKKICLSIRDGSLLFRALGALQRFEELFQVKHERSMTPSNRPPKRGSRL
jgi:hypothetical protein